MGYFQYRRIHSRVFRRAYKRIALVELDPQGTLAAWSALRARYANGHNWFSRAVTFTSMDSTSARKLNELNRTHDCIVLDTPGESQAGFVSSVAIPICDLVIVPMRISTADEHSFESNLLPMLVKYLDKVFILPSFTHPNANPDKTREYFEVVMPYGIRTLKFCLPNRGVFENYDRVGYTLHEYAASVKTNARDYRQVQKAITDIENIAREIVKYAKA